MTLCVGQPAALGCCRTSNILRAFYAAVKCFCFDKSFCFDFAARLKKKPAIWRVSLNAFYFVYLLCCNWNASNWIS